jgi:Uma2 family endonuclease
LGLPKNSHSLLVVPLMSVSQDPRKTPCVKLTYDEYVLFPDDGRRHEIIDGRHTMNPAPSPMHQYVSRHMQFQLYQQLELSGLGQVINAPIDLQLSDCDVVQPDLVVVLNGNAIITSRGIQGIPDLVVEILSPSTSEHDQQLKLRLYEQARIPEYWIVDPEDKVVFQYHLTENSVYAAPLCQKDRIQFQRQSVTADVDLSTVWYR